MKISDVNQMRDLDQRAITEFGIPDEILMENAGQATYFVILNELGIKGRNFLVFCGTGNNGGDGLVVARKIHSNGGKVKVLLLGNEVKFRGAAKKNFEIISHLPIEVHHIASTESISSDLSQAEAIVDAILGTGLEREVTGLYRSVIEAINGSGKKVFSVDIPSGINGNTGEMMGIAVKADHTITFGLPKQGNLLYPGYEMGGNLWVSHISFPPSLYSSGLIKTEINEPLRLPKRSPAGHKGDFGDALFIAGASNYLGAPYFSALSFLKAGGGYARLATPRSVSSFLASRGSEIVLLPQEETPSGSISPANKGSLLETSERVDMVVLGPGLSLDEATQKLVRELAKEIRKPLLIDGDGITAISKDLETIKRRKAETILTPHLGEMSRITGKSIGQISKDKIEILRETAKELNAIICLKGAHSLIGYPDERVFVNLSGNSGMATAGSGDVLTGTIAAIYGLGLTPEESVRTGVFIHGFSGDLAAAEKGEDGITAVDIMTYLPNALKAYREDFEGITENFYHKIDII